jgi:hypothetical protein
MHGFDIIFSVKKLVLFLTEQSDVVLIKFLSFSVFFLLFYSAFVWKCTEMCKHHFGVQLLLNPPLCSSTQFLTGDEGKLSYV